MNIFQKTFLLIFLALPGFTFSQVTPSYMPIADSFNVTNPNAVQAINIPYGDIEPQKQLFHIFLPNTEDTFPLVIFIHGGGFTGGNPGTVFKDPERRETVKFFLENDVAFISLGYRLIAEEEPDFDGVIKSLSDSKLGLQFIRHYAENLNIDPDRIAVMGSSAGAGTGLWLGTRDDMADPEASDPVLRESTRVSAVFTSATQSTYDLYKWETEIFNDFDGQGTSFTLDSIAGVMTTETVENFYGGLDSLYQIVHDPALIQYRQDVDMLYHLSSDDPPIYIFSQNTASHPSEDVLHHWYHSKEVYDVAVAANVSEVKVDIEEISLNNTDGESGNEFLLRYLSSSPNEPEITLSLEPEIELEVYPNPTTTYFWINAHGTEIKRVEIHSLSGKFIRSYVDVTDKTQIPTSSLNAGVYMLNIFSTGGQRVFKRLIVN